MDPPMPPEARNPSLRPRRHSRNHKEEFQLIAPKAKLFITEKLPVHTLLFQDWPEMHMWLIIVPVPQPNLFQVLDERGSQGEAHSSTTIQRGSRIMDHAVKPISSHFATILDLPMEIILQVFEEVECMEDLICLGLARRCFWAIARRRLHDYYMSFWGQWAGENIVYVGEFTRPGDVPPGLFSEEEIDEQISKSLSLYDIGNGSGSKEQHLECSIRKKSKRLYKACRNRDKSDDPAFKLAYSEIICQDSTYLPCKEPWILRNLTTKEFVRSEAIAIKPEYIIGPFIEYLDFHEVVVSRACWSSLSPSSAIRDPMRLGRGVWAGHRFDITTLARHNLDPQATEWRDVSEEVANEIASIWEANYGPHWRKRYVRLKKRQQADLDPWRRLFAY
ncbi:F-box domain containing protein [Metarhizium guizhouense ARSEF 977]|uniref:F-box domain containing protein n=1 Tax=Metarhizium guizhouense (strain ARSEF 977) TaxID=1276136 RepID=A0A0B4HYE6_METGA|nr:F-box domain containing protein [Metarhizium guizhouense ARSEF 977]